MTVSTTSNKVSFSANGSTTVFAYNFKIFADADLTVIIRAADGTETTKTLTTHYTVSGAGSASGGNVTFTSGNTPANGETVVIQRKLTLTQGTDYVANDPFPAESHEDALDRLTFITQQIQEEVDRSIKASVTNTISGATFTLSASDRANKVFAFDSSGNLAVTQELGTFKGNWAASTTYAVRDLVKDTSTNNIFIVNSAHTSSGAQPLTTNANSAKYDLIVDAASATSSATSASTSASTATTQASTATTKAAEAATSASTAETHKDDAETAKTAAEAAQTAAETAKTAAETALDTFDDRFLGAKSSDPTVDNDGNALIDGALYFDTTNDLMKVYDLSNTQWRQLALTGSNQTNVNTVAGQISPTNNIATVAARDSDIGTVAARDTDIGTVASRDANIGTVASRDADIGTVASRDADIGTVAARDTDIGTVAGKATEIGRLGTADAVADMALLGTADVVSDLNTLATSAIVADMDALADITSNITTVATNITDVNSFANRYAISASAPSGPSEGDLWFDTTNDIMKVYDGSGFVNAGSSVNGTSSRNTYTATAGQTTFSATYDSGFVDVYLNGVKLIAGTDFTATNGTSVVLASGAAVNDTVDIVAYGTFELLNTSINSLTDVNTSGVTNGQVLAFNSTSSDFEPTTIESFPSGTLMLFQQTSAPTGWTKQTTHNDKALRIVTGTVGSGGSSAFSTALATPSVTGTVTTSVANTTAGGSIANTTAGGTVGNHTLTVAQLASHNHAVYPHAGTLGGSTHGAGGGDAATTVHSSVTSSTGSNSAHNHSFTGTAHNHTFTGTAHNHTATSTLSSSTAGINVEYVDAIIASKD